MAVSRHAGEHSDSSSKRECEAVDESASFQAAAAVTLLVGVAMQECECCNLSARTETLAIAASASAARASGSSGGHVATVDRPRARGLRGDTSFWTQVASS